MRKAIVLLLTGILAVLFLAGCTEYENGGEQVNYNFPSEESLHEATWLNWPHEYTYGKKYRDEIEDIWVQMTKALVRGERVNIVAYDEYEKERIAGILSDEKINMSKIGFVIAKSDDVWSRDTGPMFAFNDKNEIAIIDFGFDGWGKKTPYRNDDAIPKAVAKAMNLPIVDVSDFVLEGGSVELDGSGTAMLCRSSVISKSRNDGMSQKTAEGYLKKYLGATNFIWLDGVEGEDITDAHIDGFARFFDDKTLLTVSEADFMDLYEGIKASDYSVLAGAKNARGERYEIVEFPMTSQNVSGLEYKGSYLNYYVANEVVLLPVYRDVNDRAAQEILEELYPNKTVVPIDVSKLFKNGGMIHCITQQQPAARK